jgi:hypothetical protein
LLAGSEPPDDDRGGGPKGPEDRDDWPGDDDLDTPDDESERLVFAY